MECCKKLKPFAVFRHLPNRLVIARRVFFEIARKREMKMVVIIIQFEMLTSIANAPLITLNINPIEMKKNVQQYYVFNLERVKQVNDEIKQNYNLKSPI